MKIKLHYLFLVLSIGISLFSCNKKKKTEIIPSAFVVDDNSWADTTLKYLSLEEKIGQLIIYDYGKISKRNEEFIISDFAKIMPGGIFFDTDSLSTFVHLQNNLQKNSKINLFTLQNNNLQFVDCEQFPLQSSLLAIKNDSIIKEYLEFLSQFNKKLNITLTEFPNIKKVKNNSVFNKDYLGLLKKINTIYTNKKIISIIKRNSFYENSFLNLNDSILDCGILGISSEKEDSLLINLKVKNKYGGLSLINLSKQKLSKSLILKSIKNKNELFITTEPAYLKKIFFELLQENKLTEEEITAITRKILLAKTWNGLENNIHIEQDSIEKFIKSKKNIVIINSVYKNSISLIKNKNNLIPFKNISQKKFVLINLTSNKLIKFKETLKSYHNIKSYDINTRKNDFIKKIPKLNKNINLIIIADNYLIDSVLVDKILNKTSLKNTVFVNFDKTNNLQYSNKFNSVFNLYGISETEQKYLADAIFGGIKVNGKFTSQINDSLFYGKTIKTNKIRISSELPELLAVNSEVLNKIDLIAKNGIRKGAYPGCQIVVLKNGTEIYNKCFGFHTYKKRFKVNKNDIYDLASVTKIAATTTAIMQMYDKGKVKLSHKLGHYFRDTKIDYSNIKPDTVVNVDTLYFSDIENFSEIIKQKDTINIDDSTFITIDTILVTVSPQNNIFKVKIEDMLLHKSGISPMLPIAPYVLIKKNFYDSLKVIKQRFYSQQKTDSLNFDTIIEFNEKKELQKIYDKYFTSSYIKDYSTIQITENMYLKNNYLDTLWRDTKQLKVSSKKYYKYSDINMILLQQAIDSLNRRSINSYMRTNFYMPLGLKSMTYKPIRYFNKKTIIPTEDDKQWRNQTLQAYVHDPSAAIIGGISGNAGLFSNAKDLAVLGQMWLNGGTYGGRRYISEKTIIKFTSKQKASRRGLGFDKKRRHQIIAKEASEKSFGHTGFTGTCIWVDPENDIVYVFLSNRVHPKSKNYKINKMRIRQKIHSVIYEAIKN